MKKKLVIHKYLIGGLMYLVVLTRLEIAYSVSFISQSNNY